jgi:hypothetical protein
VPALGLAATVARGVVQLGVDGLAVGGGVELADVTADDLLGAVAEQALCCAVPAHHLPLRVEEDDGEVAAAEEQTDALGGAAVCTECADCVVLIHRRLSRFGE